MSCDVLPKCNIQLFVSCNQVIQDVQKTTKQDSFLLTTEILMFFLLSYVWAYNCGIDTDALPDSSLVEEVVEDGT